MSADEIALARHYIKRLKSGEDMGAKEMLCIVRLLKRNGATVAKRKRT